MLWFAAIEIIDDVVLCVWKSFHKIVFWKTFYSGILLSYKNRNEIVLFAVMEMDLEIIKLSEVRQKKTNIIWCHFYVESKDYSTNKFIYKTKTDSET